MALEAFFADFPALLASGFAGVSCQKPTIMIAMTPRTGSTHLCASLHRAGQSVEPNEIFNPRGPIEQEKQRRRTGSFADYIASFARDPDDTFIFKTCWTDAAPLAPYITGLFPNLRVIYIGRRNFAAQAVSNLRAEQSRIWHLREGDADPQTTTEYWYDLPRLRTIVADHDSEKKGWKDWFTANGITPLRLDYEDFKADVNTALAVIMSAMALPLLAKNLPPRSGLKKLGGAESADWTERLQKQILNLS